MTTHVDEAQLSKLVAEVVRRVKADGGGTPAPAPAAPVTTAAAPVMVSPVDGIFASVDEAVEAAGVAYRTLSTMSLERRKRFIRAMRDVASEAAPRLAAATVEETGFGRTTDKVQKILLAARKTPGVEDLTPCTYTGDDGLTLVEPAPYGVIGAITPCTNPVPTVVNNSISIIAAGNTVVYNPHPAAKGVSNEIVRLLNGAIRDAGGPDTLICSLAEPTLDSSAALMKHPDIRLLLVTGGGAVVKLAMTSGKKTIAAGPGNPPVIVDDTADLAKAGRNIVRGASFDNNVLCTAEEEIFVFEQVADRLITEMKANGAYEVTGHAIDELTRILVDPDGRGHPRKEFIGQNASVLLQQIRIDAGDRTKLVICEVPSADHPLVQLEMLMPIVPIVRVSGLDEALSLALQAEHGYRHSAYMHSENVSNMSRVAREIETTIFVKNAPSFAGLGFGGEGFTTLSIAGPTGEGLTSARSFTRQRRCVLVDAFRIV